MNITYIYTKSLQCFARRYDPDQWPPYLDRPSNLKLVDWLPLNDLLGNDSLLLSFSKTLGYKKQRFLSDSKPGLQEETGSAQFFPSIILTFIETACHKFHF